MTTFISLHDAHANLNNFRAHWSALRTTGSLEITVGKTEVSIFLPVDESAFAERIVAAINRTNAPAQTIVADPKPLEALAKAREFIATELRWRNRGSWHHGENTYISTPTALLEEIDAALGKAKTDEIV